jgi:hypothetical protein
MSDVEEQIITLAILGIPVATVTWTVTHEEVLRELREWCSQKSTSCGRLYQRKFFYLLTCEYCLSHYVAALFLALTGFQLLAGVARIFPFVAGAGADRKHLYDI